MGRPSPLLGEWFLGPRSALNSVWASARIPEAAHLDTERRFSHLWADVEAELRRERTRKRIARCRPPESEARLRRILSRHANKHFPGRKLIEAGLWWTVTRGSERRVHVGIDTTTPVLSVRAEIILEP